MGLSLTSDSAQAAVDPIADVPAKARMAIDAVIILRIFMVDLFSNLFFFN